jgi:hypothetical protein
MEVFRLEQPAGDDQLIVLYVNRDTGGAVEVGEMMGEVGKDAARLRSDGWRLVSVGSLPMRESGTAGNVLFQSGGGYVTQLTVAAVYAR